MYFGERGQVTVEFIELSGSRYSANFQVIVGGIITDNMQVKLTGSRYGQIPILRESDKIDITKIALTNNFDYIIAPNIQTGREVQEIRTFLGPQGDSL